MKIGIVGIGNMGRCIAERLAEEGETLILWNRSPEKAQGIDRATVAATPKELARQADVIICVLANDTAINAAYYGADGLLAQDLTGKVVIELCTTSPETVMALEKDVVAKGGLFLECPVGGNVVPARSGQLMGLAGGSDAAFAAARPVLAKMTRRLEHLGAVGTGAAMKLAINLPLMVYWSALGEALGLVLEKGVNPSVALDILADSSGAIGAAKKRIPPIHDMLVNHEPGGVSFTLTNAIKDMKLMEALSATNGQPSPVISAARAKAEAAAAGGWGQYDCSLVGLFGQVKEN
jgi:3-hydroxyisobutyrate dehydrogenase